jgi:hypothetical protein
MSTKIVASYEKITKSNVISGFKQVFFRHAFVFSNKIGILNQSLTAVSHSLPRDIHPHLVGYTNYFECFERSTGFYVPSRRNILIVFILSSVNSNDSIIFINQIELSS